MNLLIGLVLILAVVGIFLMGGGHPVAWIAIFVILLGGAGFLVTKLAKGKGPR